MPQNASAGPSLLHRRDAMTQQRGIAFAQAIRLDEVSALREQRGAAGELCLVGRQPPKHTGSALTCIAGHSGLPQVSLPAAEVEGCPVGLSFIGWAGGDEALLDLAVTLSPFCVR